MKKQILLPTLTLLFITFFNFNAFSQSLIWNQCVLINGGSPSNFNYTKTFESVAQSSTDVQVVVGFLACQPFATNTAGIRLNGTTFSETNVSAGNCSYINTTFIISRNVFNEAVINGAGTISFSCFIRDTCVPGFGCSFTSDPCIAFTATYTACTAPITPTFAQVSNICSGAPLDALPLDSNEGITGTWAPALDNTVTTEYTFTPSEGQCATSTTMTITVDPNVFPDFTAVAPICSGFLTPQLEPISQNGISGTWTPSVIDNVTIGAANYTFTPDAGQCATDQTLTVIITAPNITPTFAVISDFCSGQTTPQLETISQNGISGSWSPSIIDNVTIGTATYTFTPDTGQCAVIRSISISVYSNVTPTFTQIAPICFEAIIPDLPGASNNGINGTWSPELNNTSTTVYTFTPSPGQCATNETMTITVDPIVAAPTGNENQTFCIGETVGNISVDGISVVWYDSPALGNIVTNDTLLTSGTTYFASQTIGSCSSNTRLSVTVLDGECLSIADFDKLNLLAFPNPIKNTLNISSENVISKISIYDIVGQKVISKAINSTIGIIDTSSLPTGTYIVKVASNDAVKTLKVFKK